MTFGTSQATSLSRDTVSSGMGVWSFSTGEQAPAGAPGRVKRWCHHGFVRAMMFLYAVALSLAKRLGRHPRSRANGEGYEILLTGRFESENWAAAHLRPLAESAACARLMVVSTYPVPEIPKVVAIYPPRWLIRVAGSAAARLLVFSRTALRRRPHIVGGFHIAFNALLSILLAPLVGARSLYFSVGGPTEILDGGVWSETKLLTGMGTPDARVERRLLQAIGACDVVITMGTGAARFLRHRGVETAIHVVSGGIDAERFRPSEDTASFDLILVGRLTETKRPDLFLRAIALAARQVPGVTAAVVGDGPLRPDLERMARDLGIGGRVTFPGFQPRASDWLKQARIFVLTSRTEGLSLAMMEAMMCGLPAVVSNVGDLGDLVTDGVSGYLVDEASPEAFADRIVAILSDRDRYAVFSHASRSAALRYETGATTHLWDGILTDLDGQRVAERR